MKNKLYGMITLIVGVMLILSFAACDIFDALPGAPTNVNAVGISSNAVIITWNAVPGATEYVVYGSINQGGPFNIIGTTDEIAVLHSQITSNGVPVSAGTTIWYKVSAKNSTGEGPQSAAVSATTISGQSSITVPGAVSNFTAAPGNGQVSLSWSAPSNNGGTVITRYEVSSNNGVTWVTATSNTGHTFTGLTNGTMYTFRVRAVNVVGAGVESTATATPFGSGGATHSLDGVWEASNGDVIIMITGSNGVIAKWDNPAPRWENAMENDFVSIGDQFFRNLAKTGDLTWTGQILTLVGNTSAPNVVTRIEYNNTTITMSADGQTIQESRSNNILTRVAINPLVNGQWVNGNLPNENSADWYSLSVTAGQTYYFWFNDICCGDGTKTGEGRVTALYSNGTEIFRESCLWDEPESFTSNTTGTIYICITPDWDTGTYGFVYSTGSTRPLSGGGTLSLDGVWERSDSRVVTISGSTGVFTQFGTASALTQDAINKGYLTIGGQAFRNLYNTGGLTWTGQMNGIDFYPSAPNVATGSSFRDCTITLSANGQSFTVNVPSVNLTETYTRTTQSSGGTFTLTGIPSQYNGRYACLRKYYDDQRIGIVGGIYNAATDIMTCVLISNGSVTIPIWMTDGWGDITERYSSNHTFNISIEIYDSPDWDYLNRLTDRDFDSVQFSNGSATRAWNSGY